MAFTLFGKGDPGKEALPRQRSITLLLTWAALVPSLGYAVLADAPLIPVLAAIGSVAALIPNRSVRINTRTQIYSFTLAAVVAVIVGLVYKVPTDHFFLPTGTLFPFLIFMAIACAFLDQRPLNIAISLACSISALMLIGSALGTPERTRLVIDHPILEDRFTVFMFCVIAQSYSVLHLHKHARGVSIRQHDESIRAHVRRNIVNAVATILMFALAVGLIYGTNIAFNRWGKVLDNQYLQYVRRFSDKQIFSTEVSLNQTIQWKGQDQNGVAMLVRSNIPPGYLRGRVYRNYKDGKWKGVEGVKQLPLRREEGLISTGTFTSENADLQNCESMDVYPHRRFVPSQLYTPGNLAGLELIADRIERTADGTLVPHGWDRSGGYRAYVPKIDQAIAWQRPQAPDDSYLDLPLPIDIDIIVKARRIVSPDADARTKVQAITEHLRNNYEYKLERADSDRDPVLHFLEDRKAGHCELFATAAALMLRAVGVKTRYVTGYVSFGNPGDNDPATWVLRFRDCHAWIEAWIPGKGWQLVEATPASGVPVADDPGLFARMGSGISGAWSWLFATVKRGYFARAVLGILAAVGNAILWLFWSGPWYLSYPIAIGIAMLIIRRRRQKASESRPQDQQFQEIQRLLQRFLRARKVNVQPCMSLREIATAVEDAKLPNAGEFRKLVLQYESLRYSQNPKPEQILQFTQTFRNWARA